MIVDASVWVATFRANDVHHKTCLWFLEAALAQQQDLNVPNVAFAEIAGVFARQTGKARIATRTVATIMALPRLRRHALHDALADRATALAARCKLRGADSVYVALAEALGEPLVTLDQETLDRSIGFAATVTPLAWVKASTG